MNCITRAVDQWVMIGQGIFVGPTDIDDKTARLLARGRMLGGPTDGGTFQSVHELSRGQSFAIGPCIIVTLVDIIGDKVQLGVAAPSNLPVHRKEESPDQHKLKGNDAD